MSEVNLITTWIEDEYDYNKILNLVDEYSAENPKADYPRCYQNGDTEHYWGSVVGYTDDMVAFVKRYQCESVIQHYFPELLNVIGCLTKFDSFFDSIGHDSVNHPLHYNFAHEPIDVIADWGLNFNLGNTVKYISRAGRKDPNKTLEDLKKAKFYLDYEIEHFGEEK